MRSTALNLILFIALLGILSWGLLTYLSPPKLDDYIIENGIADPAIPAAAQTQNLNVLKVPSIAQYHETTARPLFYPARRPPKPDEPVVVDTSEPAPPPPEVEMALIGVLMTPQSTTAMVKVEDDNKTNLLKIGDKIDAWQLAEIKPNSVLFRKGKETREVALLRNNRKPTMTPHSLRQKPAPEDRQATENVDPDDETQQVDAEPQEAAEERLRLRQERLKAIAERRRQLLQQQRERAAARSRRGSNQTNNQDNNQENISGATRIGP